MPTVLCNIIYIPASQYFLFFFLENIFTADLSGPTSKIIQNIIHICTFIEMCTKELNRRDETYVYCEFIQTRVHTFHASKNISPS